MEDTLVKYDTNIEELKTRTNFDFPDTDLTIEELVVPNSDEESVVGSFTKPSDKFATIQTGSTWNKSKDETLHEKLFPVKQFKDYLDIPVDRDILKETIDTLSTVDARYGLMMEEVKTQKDLLQWFVNFRWRRFNILDNYISFTKYADLVTSILSLVKVSSDFPVLITGNTIMKKTPSRVYNGSFYVDYTNDTVVHTSEEYRAIMSSRLGEKNEQSLNLVNMSMYWSGADWLITNNRGWLTLSSVNDVVKKITVSYNIDAVTGIRYTKDYVVIYVLSNYTEHAIIIDKDFKIVEDSVTEIFNQDIVTLMDPKTIIFRDKYQYYVNNEDGTFSTFPLIDMFDINNKLIKKYTIIKTTLDDPRPVSIVDNGPRLNTKYNGQYQLMWSYNNDISLMTLYPAMGYEFDKYSFYNPRKYLKDSDYDEACIPMHGGFRRTLIYPWLWRRDGFTWVGDHYYRGYYNYWNMFWWFYW